MRKIKILIAMSLCVFLFSGCGGSAGTSDDSETEETSTLHENVSAALTGSWVLDSTAEGVIYTGSGTINPATTAVTLTQASEFMISFSAPDFASESNESAGNVDVFYSHVATLYDRSGASRGTLSIKSYTDASAESKVQNMVIRRVTDDKWVLTSPNTDTKITISISSWTAPAIDIEMTGSGSNSTLGDFTYNITCSLAKKSATPSTEDGDDTGDDDATALHTSVNTALKGSWVLDTTSLVYSGTGTINAGATAVTLSKDSEFWISFSDLDFASSSYSSAGNVDVFFSHLATLYDTSGNPQGTLSIKSYTDSSAESKVQNMVIRREADDKWVISSTNTTITVTIASMSIPKISIEMTGSGTNSTLGDYTYSITCSLMKKSSELSTDDGTSDDSGSTDSTIADSLEGTWQLSQETSATATSTTLGTDKVLNLTLATNVDLTISNINLTTDDSTTSLTGTARVVYTQKWTAFDSYDETQVGDIGGFTFSKNEVMRLVKIADGQWRIEDINNEDDQILITVVSPTEISTEWNGVTTTLDDMGYRYKIECSFTKK